jgi:transposase
MLKRQNLSNEQIKFIREFIKAKKASAEELARAQAILMYARGEIFDSIKELTGLGRSALFKWKKRFVDLGILGLLDKKKKGPKPLLTKNQILEITKMLCSETPRAYGYSTDFWSTPVLAELIEQRYNVRYKSKRPMYVLFQESKFTYHKPGQKYHKRNQEEIDQWIKEKKSVVGQYLKDDTVVVLTADEMVLSTQTTFQKVWLPINQYPKIDVSNERKNRSIYGFLNVKNGVEWAFKTEWQNSITTCEILDKIGQLYPKQLIVILWDNASWHRSKEVREYLSRTPHRFKLISYPRYAPELNPQEHVWKAARSAVSHNNFIEDIDKATDKFVAYLSGRLFKYDLLSISPRI